MINGGSRTTPRGTQGCRRSRRSCSRGSEDCCTLQTQASEPPTAPRRRALRAPRNHCKVRQLRTYTGLSVKSLQAQAVFRHNHTKVQEYSRGRDEGHVTCFAMGCRSFIRYTWGLTGGRGEGSALYTGRILVITDRQSACCEGSHASTAFPMRCGKEPATRLFPQEPFVWAKISTRTTLRWHSWWTTNATRVWISPRHRPSHQASPWLPSASSLATKKCGSERESY